MADFHFLRPWLLLTFIPLLAVWWGLWRRQKASEKWQDHIDPHLLPHLLVGKNEKPPLRPLHLLLVVWVLSVFGVAGPTWQKEPSPFVSDEAALMVLLKVSETMEAADIQPSRLERAKQKIRDIMELRKGGATGLVVYSGSAHLVMPVTRDDRIIQSMLEAVSTELMPVAGDALDEGLDLGVQMLRQSGLAGSILVIADSAASRSVEKLPVPVQFLSIQTYDSDVDAGLANVAKSLGGEVVKLTADRSDAEKIISRAESSQAGVIDPDQEENWKDSGYLLLPLIGLGALLWFRKGWVLQ